MVDRFEEQRLAELERRWSRDPSSRLFLQIAEEYRRLGQLARSASVLEAGLRHHPGYVSALVSLGRTRLDLGEPEVAIGVLERALAADGAQLVANKLLVEALLRVGRRDEATRRLIVYRLLNPRDPDLPGLTARASTNLGALEAAWREAGPASDRSTAATAPPGERAIDVPADAAVEAAPEVREAVVAIEAQPPDEEPFGIVVPLALAHSVVEELALHGVFAWSVAPVALAEPEEPVAPSVAATAERAGDAWVAEARLAEAEHEAAEWFDDALGETPPAVEPTPAVEPPPIATSTLGALYLEQGHLAEAESLFEQVIERVPESPVARRALAEIDGRRSDARPVAPEPYLGLTQRRIQALRGYLAGVRRNAERPHVP